MKKILINGGKILSGQLKVSGSKNAALPMLLSTLVISGESEIACVPKIGDTEVAINILSEFGVRAEWQGEKLKINTGEAHFAVPSEELVSKIRASTYLIGASLARFGEARILKYGGCDFAARPIDLHIEAAKALGAKLSGDRLYAKRLVGGEINFPHPSVGATVNALIMAASAEGESVIRGFAREPHIMSLIDYLVSAGADIKLSESEIRITGRPLSKANGRVRPDMIEAGSYIATALLVGGDVTVSGVPSEELISFFSFLESLGAVFSLAEDSVRVEGLNASGMADITAAPYPAFPTDLQPIAAPLMAAANGGRIVDTVWPERFGYLDTLSRFGVVSERFFGGARIFPSEIRPASVIAPDLRGGFASVMLSLFAEGESTVYSSDTVLRGYERIEEKLRLIGADIKVLDS